MAIKIRPARGEIPSPRFTQDRSMLRFAQFARADGTGLPKTLTDVAGVVANHEAKMDVQRVKNKLALNEAKLSQRLIERTQELKESDIDISNPFEINKLKMEEEKYIDSWVKSTFANDEKAFKQFEPLRFNYLSNFTSNLYVLKNKKILDDAVYSHSVNKQKLNANIDTMPINSNVWNKRTEFFRDLRTTAESANQASPSGVAIDSAAEEDAFNKRIWERVVIEGNLVPSYRPNETIINYDEILKGLNNPTKTEYFGEQLPSDIRKHLKDWAKKGRKDQEQDKVYYENRINSASSAKALDIIDQARKGEMSLPEAQKQFEQIEFTGASGKKSQSSLQEHIVNLSITGTNTVENLVNSKYIQEQIALGNITSLTEDQITESTLLERYNTLTGKKEKAVSLVELAQVNILKKEDIYSNGFINKMIANFADPQKKADFAALENWIKSQEPLITASKQNPLSNIKAELRFNDFAIDMRERFMKGYNNNIPMKELLDSRNKNFIWNDRTVTTDQGGYVPSQGDVIKESISTGTGKPLPTVPEEIIELQKTLKKFKEEQNMTFQEIKQTDEYKKLESLKAKQ
tara:strand:+ start:548 stop:2275 length:1728 start_codon:yes stop_codon:yes gene_type:complete